jgi:tetratricopeptide (TPR) repeat protein
LRARHGKAVELWDALVADAKAHADDVERFARIIELRDAVSPQPDVAWIADAFRPKSAFDAAMLGQRLRGRPAVTILERAAEIPITKEDVAAARQFARRFASMPSFTDDDAHWTAWVRASIRLALLGAYREAGDAQKAQSLMVAIADEAPARHGLPSVSLFLAGKLQADSGAREIEGRVRAGESGNEQSPEYWTGRAEYFEGRGEKAQALEAVDRALALTPPATSETSSWGRYFLILRRVGLLEREKGYAFLRAEIERMPDDLEVTTHLLKKLADEYRDLIPADDPRMWRYLAATAEWKSSETWLLRVLVDKRTPEEREAFWKRAEALAQGAAPSRAAALGDVAYRQADAGRAAALLASAVERLPEGVERNAAGVRLFEAVTAARDWKRADAVWPIARRGLHPREQHGWLAGLATAQARDGAADEAMRTWARAVGLDRVDVSRLPGLAKAGMKARLVAFYGELLKRDPAAETAVRRALVVVGE